MVPELDRLRALLGAGVFGGFYRTSDNSLEDTIFNIPKTQE